MKQPDFERARQYVFGRLAAELSPKLYYHGIHHTRDDVMPAVERLADLAGIMGEPRLLLRTAALYHDIGWVVQKIDHELIGVEIARTTLPDFGFNEGQIELIAALIRATQWPQTPQTYLEELMCDADLDTLGRIDFFVTSQLLRLEMLAHGIEIGLRDWHESQLEFLSDHHYFTAVAQSLRNEGKRKNLSEIKHLLRLADG